MKILVILALLVISINSQNNNQVFKGIVGRKWYFGGSFTSAINADGSLTNAQNFVSWNGTRWEVVGNASPNGQVNVVTFDLCKNVYIGGQFSSVGTVSGPAARYNVVKKIWEQIGNTGDLVWSNGSYINDIAVNCRNWLDTSLQCPCSVYLVGNFNVTIVSSGAVATNVIKYEFSTKAWDNLGGAAAHGMVNGEIFGVNAKDFGVTVAIYNVYFIGSFTGKFQKLNNQNGLVWGFKDQTIKTKFNGNINYQYYVIQLTGTDKLYLAGDFSFQGQGGLITRVCYFDYVQELFYPVGNAQNPPNLAVNTVALSGSTVFIGGQFTNTNSKYISKLTTVWDSLGTPSTDGVIFTPPQEIDVCNPSGQLQLDCTGGSTAVAGGNMTKYFDAKTNLWTDFGLGVNGITYTTQSQFSSAKSLSFGLVLSFITAFALNLF